MKPLQKWLLRKGQKERIDCRWCGCTIFTAASPCWKCPQCQAMLPDAIAGITFLFSVFILGEIALYTLFVIPTKLGVIERINFFLGNNSNTQAGLVIKFILALIAWHFVTKALGILYEVDKVVLLFWGWHNEKKTGTWLCSPTKIPNSYILRDIYLSIIRPNDIRWGYIVIGALTFLLPMILLLGLLPLPQRTAEIPQFVASAILLTGLVTLLISLLPFQRPTTVLLAAAFGLAAGMQFALAEDPFKLDIQEYSFLLLIKYASLPAVFLTFIATFVVGNKISRFCFGTLIYQVESQPVSLEEMQIARTTVVPKKHWVDRVIENDILIRRLQSDIEQSDEKG